ncbi:putative short-chain dehydrogenase/reductase SDR [Magnetofaba australis IT-1]|uniref:Putative short-chain dehydrogenase/reductase SDR n=2 Tax=Magnetofaba TaxID=1472292 RepID=A0A1Y2K229_9PROT|nr:putative short-chain dehydrogenase/reductase SDR [Magnetofaba australis IT-1]
MARGCAIELAKRGHPLYLSGRDDEELRRLALDLSVRYGVTVHHGEFDIEEIDSHADALKQVIETCGGLYGVVFAIGYLGDHLKAREEWREANAIIVRNFTGAVSVLGLAANHLEKQADGFIIGVTSVAADRGRQSNYPYGAPKAGLSAWLAGLRNRLAPTGVRVIEIKPGYVDTAMTYGLPGLFLVADPNDVGRDIVRALDKSRDVLYLPGFWRLIMLIIRSVPEPIFKKMKL